MVSNNSTVWLTAFSELEGDIFANLNDEDIKYHRLSDTRCAHQRIIEDDIKFKRDFVEAREALEKVIQPYERGYEIDLFHNYVGVANKWIFEEDQTKTPSIPALVAAFYSLRGIEPSDNPSMMSSLVASVLAEIEHDYAFHNNAHFREVVFTRMMLLSQEENLSNKKYSDKYIADSLRRSLLHDMFVFGRDNNFRREKPDKKAAYKEYYMEQLPAEGTRGYMEVCGLSNDEIEDDLIINLTTDLSSKVPKDEEETYSASDHLWRISAYHADPKARGRGRPGYLPKLLKPFLSEETNPELYGELTRGKYLTGAAEGNTDADTLISVMCPMSSAFRYNLLQQEFPEKYSGTAGDIAYTNFVKFAYHIASHDIKEKFNLFHSYAANILFEKIAEHNISKANERIASQTPLTLKMPAKFNL